MGQKWKSADQEADGPVRDAAPKRSKPRGRREPGTVTMCYTGPDGTKYEVIPGQEDLLPPEVQEELDRLRRAAWESLVESFAKRDDGLGEAIRFYRSIPTDQRERPECKELLEVIVDAMKGHSGDSG